MLAEWSAECSAEDPVLVVPWNDPGGNSAFGNSRFIDLRSNPHGFDAIPEAEQHPPLMQALRALNATRSPVFTAKCNAWPLDADELHQLQLDLGASPAITSSAAPTGPAFGFTSYPAGFASYIDLLWRDPSLFPSFHRQEQMLRHLTRLAAPIRRPAAALDCVLRPALLDFDSAPREGYAVSLYVKALGPTPLSAWKEWAAALAAAVALVRGKAFAR